MANRFYIEPADSSQMFGGIGQMLRSLSERGDRKQERDIRQQEIDLRQEEINRMRQLREAQSRVFGVDPSTGEIMQGIGGLMPQDESMMEEAPKQMRPDQAAISPKQEILDYARDPQAAKEERAILDNMGITPDKYGEIKQFSDRIKTASDEEIPGIIKERIETVVARGGDARDTASLLSMNPQQARQAVSAVGMITDMNALRQMMAIDPVYTQKILDTSLSKGDTDFTRKWQLLQEIQAMPEGTKKEKEAKEQRLMMLGAMPKGRSVEEALELERQKSDLSVEEFAKKQGIRLSTEADIERSIAQAKKEGTLTGEDTQLYDDINAQLPALYDVVDNLRELADVATYTKGGRAYDVAVKELGFKPTEGATARAKYIATVDNEVLPLLRQTFGAAFTAQEGQSLKATLGDPDASPAEKQAQLDAFIESKVRQMRQLGRKIGRSGEPPANPNQPANAPKFLGFE